MAELFSTRLSIPASVVEVRFFAAGGDTVFHFFTRADIR